MAGSGLGLFYQNSPNTAAFGECDLTATDDALTSAVLISLFTWRRANPDDWLPAEDGNLQGWWADADLGSRLWLLQRAPADGLTAVRAKEYAGEALRWLLDEGVATEVQIEAAIDRERLFLGLTVRRDLAAEPLLTLRFQNLWDALTTAYPQ